MNNYVFYNVCLLLLLVLHIDVIREIQASHFEIKLPSFEVLDFITFPTVHKFSISEF